MRQISEYLNSQEFPNGRFILATILGALGLTTLNIYGFLQYFPKEVWYFFDAHFYSSHASIFLITVSGSALWARLFWFLLLRTCFGVGQLAISSKNEKTRLGNVRKYCVIMRRWLNKKRVLLQITIGLFVFLYSYLGFIFTFMFFIFTAIGGGALSYFYLRRTLGSRRQQGLVIPFLLVLPVATAALGFTKASKTLLDSVEIKIQSETLKGAIVATTSSGILLVRDFDAEEHATLDTSILFIPHSSYSFVASPISTYYSWLR